MRAMQKIAALVAALAVSSLLVAPANAAWYGHLGHYAGGHGYYHGHAWGGHRGYAIGGYGGYYTPYYAPYYDDGYAYGYPYRYGYYVRARRSRCRRSAQSQT
jgi:hypothetical protein